MNEDNTLSYEEWKETTTYGRESVSIVKNLLDDGVIDGFIEIPTP